MSTATVEVTKEKSPQAGELEGFQNNDTLQGSSALNLSGSEAIEQDAGWDAHRVVVFHGQLDSHASEAPQLAHKYGHDYETATLGDVFGMKPASVDKSRAPAMIPSGYFAFNARTHDVQQKRGSFVALTGDIDEGSPSIDMVEQAVRGFAGDDVAVLIYSSSSATADMKKWRVVIPLAKPCTFAQWEELQHVFFGFMEGQGLKMDWALARAAQPVYLPNVPANKRSADGEPMFHERLATDGAGLTLSHPVVATCLETLRENKARADAAAEQAKAKARAKTMERQASGDASPVDEFNKAYTVEEMLQSNGYTEGPRNNWRSPYQSSKTFATRSYGDHWVSLSESDVTAGLGIKCQKGGCSGDAFDLFCHFEHGGDTKKAVRAASIQLGLSKTPIKSNQPSIMDLEAAKRAQEARSMASLPGIAGAVGQATGEVLEGQVAQPDLAGFHILEMPDGIKPTEFVIDGFLPNGVTVISGAPGAGKTTNLEPLAASVAHLAPAEWGFRPKRRRKVVWLSEHPEQVFDTMEAIMREAGAASREEWAQWFKVVPTKRSSPQELANLIEAVNARFSLQNERGVWVRPLIVWDTAAATIDVDNENDNSTISKALAEAKRVLNGGALWVVHHTPKADKEADSVQAMSARGGGAFEGDPNCTAYLFTDKQSGRRVLGLGKFRFAPEFTEVHFGSAPHTVTIIDDFDGEELDKTVTAGIPSRGNKEGRQAEKKDTHQAAQMDAILQAAVEAASAGVLCSRNDIFGRLTLGVRKQDFGPMVNRMISNGMLVEVDVPKAVHRSLKLNNKKTAVVLPASAVPASVFEAALRHSVGSGDLETNGATSVKFEGGQQ
jgi:hypothetical protein